MVPGLDSEMERGVKVIVDGGYYCRKADNRPLIGQPRSKAFLFWERFPAIMARKPPDLLATYISTTRPDYAPRFTLRASGSGVSARETPDARRSTLSSVLG
jgi:hypothetical protein